MFLKARPLLRKLREALYALLYPDLCIACGASVACGGCEPCGASVSYEANVACGEMPGLPKASVVAPFCLNCINKIRRIDGPACACCGAPFVSEAATSHTPNQRCFDCVAYPPPFKKAITPFFYEPPLSLAICQFKYEKRTSWADFFVGLLMDTGMNLDCDRVMAIPLHPDRLRLREFNQSLLLANVLAKRKSLPLSLDALVRSHSTPPQVGLPKKKREENIKGAFRVVRPQEVAGQRILLVDDVYTTGTTLKEGARALIAAGAREVTVVAIARMV